MYPVHPLTPPSTYPLYASRRSRGSAFTRALLWAFASPGQSSGKSKSKSKSKSFKQHQPLVGAGLPAMAALWSSRQNEVPASRASPAPTEKISRSQIPHPNRPAGRPPQRHLIYPPHREAERRFCAVGLPAWMPGEPRWAMDGPWRRAHGAKPARGNLSAAKAGRQGQAFLVTFSASGKSDSP